MSFIRLKVRAAFMVHGYDADNREIVEQIGEERFVEKLLRIERIQSISEKYLLVSASHGRVAYWEYEGRPDGAAAAPGAGRIALVGKGPSRGPSLHLPSAPG